jgi:hypothetical protein
MTKFATVISDGLNVRAKPREGTSIVGVLKKGDRREILDRDESVPGFVWLKLKLNHGKDGWVYSKYVTVASNVPDYEPPHIPIPDTSLSKMGATIAVILAACAALAYCVR